MSDVDHLAFEILRAMRKILRKTAEHSRVVARKSGMNVPQVLCLRAIAESNDSEMTAAKVAATVQLSTPTVSRILDRLDSEGLITRERDRVDRRRVILRLTDKGSQRLALLPTPLQDQFLARLKTLDAAHQQLLHEALNQLVELMAASDVDAGPMLTTDHEAVPTTPEAGK